MTIKEKRETKREKALFNTNNAAFITQYELITQKKTNKQKVMKELKLSNTEFNNLKKQHLKVNYGIEN